MISRLPIYLKIGYPAQPSPSISPISLAVESATRGSAQRRAVNNALFNYCPLPPTPQKQNILYSLLKRLFAQWQKWYVELQQVDIRFNLLNISIKLFIQRGLIECKPVSFHLRHLFRCNIVMQRAKPKIKRHQSQDAIVPFKHQPTLLCFFGFVTTNETQIQRSKWARQGGWIGQ